MRRALSALLFAAAVAFLALALVRTYDRLPRETLDIHPVYAAAAILVAAAAYVLHAFVWRYLMQRPGVDVTPSQAVRIVSLSQIAKYVPGGVWQPVSWIALTRGVGITAGVAGVTLIALMALDLASALVVGPVLLAVSNASAHFVWLLLLVPPALAIVHPTVMSKGLRIVERVLRRPRIDVSLVPTHRLLWGLVGKVPVWLALGLANVLTARAMNISAPGDWLLLTGGYAVAWAVGFLALPVPSGLGVREAVFVFILRAAFPTPTALVLAVATRFLYIVAEGGLALIAVLIPKGRSAAPASATEPLGPTS